MKIEVIPQFELGGLRRIRVGDYLNISLRESQYRRFHFAVAYMRLSGLSRLALAIESLLNRGGHVSGSVGIDEGITTIDALEALSKISSDSTIFYTTSGFIYHPKLYIISGEKYAVVIVGSANLTREGLFRNVEIATAVHLDFEFSLDLEVYNRYELVISELLNTNNPNVQLITQNTIQKLATAGLIKSESQTYEPGPPTRSKKVSQEEVILTDIEILFPRLRIPAAPPLGRITHKYSTERTQTALTPIITATSATFLMQLSSFDCSHRTGVKGTPEVLVPHASISFFPELSRSGRKYPDAFFDVIPNTPTGSELHEYRLWYYEESSRYEN